MAKATEGERYKALERLLRIHPQARLWTENPYKERMDAQIRDLGERWVLHPMNGKQAAKPAQAHREKLGLRKANER